MEKFSRSLLGPWVLDPNQVHVRSTDVHLHALKALPCSTQHENSAIELTKYKEFLEKFK